MHDDDHCEQCGDIIAVDLLMQVPRPSICETCANHDEE